MINNGWISLQNKEAELIESVQTNIDQSYTYRKDLSWLNFDDEPRAQESQPASEVPTVLNIRF